MTYCWNQEKNKNIKTLLKKKIYIKLYKSFFRYSLTLKFSLNKICLQK
jgi:hypothetical protein